MAVPEPQDRRALAPLARQGGAARSPVPGPQRRPQRGPRPDLVPAPDRRPSAASPAARLCATLVAFVALVSGTLAGRAVWCVTTRPGADNVTQHLAFLDGALREGAAPRVQGRFPEGFVLTHALVGLVHAQRALPGERDEIAAVRSALTALDSPTGRASFPAAASPPYGAFHAGWASLLATEHARLTGWEEDRGAARARAIRIRDALRTSGSGFLESHPGRRWPGDTVLAVAALARADRVVGVPGARPVIEAWVARADRIRDADTGLLPHRLVGPDTRVAADSPGNVRVEVSEGPRAASQAMILAFEPEIDVVRSARDYRAFVRTFVTRRAGLVGIREYPRGREGRGDVDSGPLLLGMSASSSTVAVAAARRNGDRRLARTLESEAEFLGFPVTVTERRRYLGGLLPGGDALLLWARTRPFPRGDAAGGGPVVTPAPTTARVGRSVTPTTARVGRSVTPTTARVGRSVTPTTGPRVPASRMAPTPVPDPLGPEVPGLPGSPSWLWWVWCLLFLLPVSPAVVLVERAVPAPARPRAV